MVCDGWDGWRKSGLRGFVTREHVPNPVHLVSFNTDARTHVPRRSGGVRRAFLPPSL